tara:strand:- start:313 stop:609 length:297 start_codon:yes stop_codon:yes gene_type:complete
MDWLPYIIIFFLVGFYARLWFLIRDIKCIHDLVHEIHDHVFMKTGDVQVGDGENFHVLSLEDFMDRFGFDPREGEGTPSTDDVKASASEIEAWDNAKV